MIDYGTPLPAVEPDRELMDGLTISDLMGDEVLNELLRSIDAISNLRISMSTCQNERLLTMNDIQNDFCRRANGTQELRDICVRCTLTGGRRGACDRAPYLYRCYAGFACAAIPVVAEGTHVATIVASGFRVEQEHMEQLELLFPEESWRADPAELESAPFVHYRRITEIASLLSVAARYISEAGLRNRMQAELHQKRMELMAQRQVQLETERLLSQAEFKALQSQINPHFLFNTLGAISQLAIVDGSERTADAIFSLSALFRRSLNNRDVSPQLGDELTGIDEYLNIKRLLYRDRIRYERDVDPACLFLRVPLFTLQPIVENALLHGLEPKPEGGTLTLSIRQERSFAVVRVRDDGCGCDAETAERIRQGKTDAGRSDLTGIGMRNVIGRLTSHFGPQFHWSFESVPGQGTCVTLCLPMQPEVTE